jgi:hypothetical protein
MRADNLRNNIAARRAANSELRSKLAEMTGDPEVATMRELCYSLEEKVCWEALGHDALQDFRYRFKHLKDEDEDRNTIARFLSVFEVDEKHFRMIRKYVKKSGRTTGHVYKSNISAEKVRVLLLEALQSSETVEKFMAMLEWSGMIKDDIVDVFCSPWIGRHERRG